MTLAATLLALVTSAHAYSFLEGDTGVDLHWPANDAPVFLYLNPTNDLGLPEDAVEEALLDAIDTWNGTNASISFAYEGRSDNSENAADQCNLVWFDGEWADDTGLVAKAFTGVQADEFIVTADIAINTADYDWVLDGTGDGLDLQSVLTHELGHTLGLDHSEDALATMYGTGGPGETHKRSLRTDDIEAILALYPRSGEVACSSVAPSHIAPLALLLALPTFLLRRRNPLKGARA